MGHVGPEAYVGGMIGLLNDSDKIIIDAENGSINVELDDNEIEKKKKKNLEGRAKFRKRNSLEYAQSVGSSQNGAVTHPGAFKEKKCYADI